MEMWAAGEKSLSVSRISWKRTMSTGTLDQVFILLWTFKATWEFAEQVCKCFVDLEKAFNRIP